MAHRFNSPTRYIIFGSFKLSDGVLNEARSGITYISLADRDMKSMTETIIDAVRDQSVPKNILVTAYQKFVGGARWSVLKSFIWEIVEEVKAQKFNRLAFSTCYFVPSHEKVWHSVAVFNREAQTANESLGIARVNGHKAVMMFVSPKSKERMVNPDQWLEHQLGLHIGNHLSFEGQKNLIRFFRPVFDKTFSYNHLPARYPPEIMKPQSLAKTPGFHDIPFMRQILRAKMIIVEPTPEGERPLRCASSYDMPGWRDWRVFKDNGKLERFSQKEGILEAAIIWAKQGDAVPDWTQMMEQDREQDVEVIEEEVIVEEVVEMEVANGNNDEIEDHLIREDDPVREVEVVNGEISLEEIEVLEIVGGETEQNERRNNNEDELMRRMDELNRKLEIEIEKSTAYKNALDAQEVKVAREKAATKQWKSVVELKEIELSKVKNRYADLERELDHVNGNWDRMTAEYEYLRNICGLEKKKLTRLRITRKYTKDEDHKKYGKNHM